MRTMLMWMSVEMVSGVRIVQCHAIMDVVIGVRVMEYHAIMDVVIGIRVMLCHQAVYILDFPLLNFPLRVQILILLSCCINSSSLFPVAILCTSLHRENTSFEVWYLHLRQHVDTEHDCQKWHPGRGEGMPSPSPPTHRLDVEGLH